MSEPISSINPQDEKNELDVSAESVETVSDPILFFEKFYNSENFFTGVHSENINIQGLNDFKERVQNRVASDVTDDEIRNAYLDSDDAKLLMLNFAQTSCHFKWEPSQCSKEVNLAYMRYSNFLRKMQSYKHSISLHEESDLDRRERILDDDIQRQVLHSATAKVLQDEHLAPSYRLARAFARIMLIGDNLDTYDGVQLDETERFKRLANSLNHM